MWIEIYRQGYITGVTGVTPLAGVWIEIDPFLKYLICMIVTPLAGVWIEIGDGGRDAEGDQVTPLAGVWIEIWISNYPMLFYHGHSPCGSVD